MNFSSIVSRLIKITLLLGLFGFIPGAWLLGLPSLIIYGVYKRAAVKRGILNFIQRTGNFWANFSAHFGEFLSNQIIFHPINLLKLFASLLLLSELSYIFCFFGIWGLYSYSNQEWQNTFMKCVDGVHRFFAVGVANTLRNVSFNKKMVLGMIASIAVALFAKSSGPFFLLGVASSAALYALCYVGISAFWRDAKVWLKNVIPNTAKNSGKFLGIHWGWGLSYELCTGTLEGTLGPAMGQVKSPGIWSSVLPAILTPQGGWFTVNSGYYNIWWSKLSTMFNSMLSTFFFSHNMKVWGEFHGTYGPTATQIFWSWGIGFLVGYAAEKLVDSLYETMEEDAVQAIESAKPALYNAKWHITYTAIATPIILTSPGAGQILALAGGSLLGAAGLTATVIGLSMVAFYAVKDAIVERFNPPAQRAAQRDRPPAAARAAAVALPAPAPGFLPRFEGRQAQNQDPHPNPLPQMEEGIRNVPR